jgi:hypothetical protein
MAGVVCAIATVLPLQAADFGGQQAYQFSNSNDQLAKVATATLMLQKKAGAFNYDYTTNVGQEVNCNQQISAIGNSAQPSNSGSGIAPAGILNSGISASTTGNQSTATTTSTGSSGNQTGTSTTASPLTPIAGLPAATTNGQSANGGTSNLVGQSNQGSALNSSVAGSSLSSQMGSINASGAQILNSVSSTQSNAGSTIMASAGSSSACQWGSSSHSATANGP